MILLLTLCHGISHLFCFSLRLLPAAMAAKWHVSDLVQESTSMASLVSARNDCPRMAASLVKQWLLKLKGATLSATDLVTLTQHLEQLTLPEGSKQSMLEAVDELVISGGNLQPSMKLTQMPQKHDFIHNYLTQNDWNTLHTQGLWAGVKTLVARLRKIGVNSCKEGIKRQVLAILVMIECQQRKMPPYEEIYELGDHFSQAFNASSYRCAQGVPSLAEYPENPEQVGPNFVSLAYPAGEPPVAKHLEDINYIAWNHIPLRDTSKLLKKNQKKNGTRRRYKDQSDDDDDCQRAHILLKKAKELMNSDDGDLALALKAEKFKPKRFKALPSQSSFSSGSGAAGSAQASPTPSQVPMQPLPPRQAQLPLALPAPAPTDQPTAQPEASSSSRQEKTAEELEEEAFANFSKKPAPKGNPKAKAKGKAAGKGVLKRPAARAPPPRQVSAGSAAVVRPGCMRCRGNTNGCDVCLRESFQGARCHGREAWKAELAKRGRSWK